MGSGQRALRPPDTRGGGGSAAHPPSGRLGQLSGTGLLSCCPGSPVSPPSEGLIFFFFLRGLKRPSIIQATYCCLFSFPTEPNHRTARLQFLPSPPFVEVGRLAPPAR